MIRVPSIVLARFHPARIVPVIRKFPLWPVVGLIREHINNTLLATTGLTRTISATSKTSLWTDENLSDTLKEYKSASPADKSNKKAKSVEDPNDNGPEYDPGALAHTFFSNPYFYDHLDPDQRQLIANAFDGIRRKFFNDRTVLEFLGPLKSVNGLKIAFNGTGVNVDMVIPYWEKASTNVPPEVVLHSKILIVLGGIELQLINKLYVNLPTFHRDVDKTDERANDIRFVLGPSGSGKTFCAVKVAAVEDISKDEKYVTVYFNLKSELDKDLSDSNYYVNEVKRILKDTCVHENANYDQETKLNLTLSVVLDEAGATHLHGRFESSRRTNELYEELLKIATNLRLVVCGTGLVANEYGTGTDAIKYRMQPWSEADLKQVNEHRKYVPSEVCDAIMQHPNLRPVTTNARAAYFLLKRVRDFLKAGIDPKTPIEESVASQFTQQINSYAPEIIRRVVTDYISCNGIRRLNDEQRRRVAAALFYVLEEARINDKKKVIHIPKEFPGLNSTEKDVALSLVSINIETYGENYVTYVKGEKRSVSISPALTFVLYWTCGVPIPMLSGWKAQELLSALYEWRRLTRFCVTNYKNGTLDLVQYINNLYSLRLIELRRRIPEPNAKTQFRIPLVSNWTIWVNKEMAPYADVVGPHSLYHSKSSEKNETIEFNLLDELGKCGLVKKLDLFTDPDKLNRNDVGWAITKSLEYIWLMEKNEGDVTTSLSNAVSKKKDDEDESLMNFYPDEQMTFPSVTVDCNYATLNRDDSVWSLDLPDNSKVIISDVENLSQELFFYISCNQNRIILTRQPEFGKTIRLAISNKCLDDSGNIKEDSLNEDDIEEWKFYQGVLRNNVKIRFLLA